MNEKRKLILDFALDCFFIVLCCLTMVVPFLASHIDWFWIMIFWSLAGYFKFFSPKKPKPKKRDRELTTAEVIAVFAIAISGFYILIKIAGLLHSIDFVIPTGIIILAIRLIRFSKELAALQTSKPASN